MPRFQPPPRRTQHADFLALRSPVCFASRLMGPIRSGFRRWSNHSVAIEQLPSEFGTAIPPTHRAQPKPCRFRAQSSELPGRLSLRLDVYSPPQVLQIDGRLCHLVLAFLVVGDVTNSRAPSLHGRYPASTLLRTHPSPFSPSIDFPVEPVIRSTPAPAISRRDEEELLQLLGMSLLHRAVASTPAEVKEPHRSDFGSPCCLSALRLGARPFGATHFRGHFCVHCRYGPVNPRRLPTGDVVDRLQSSLVSRHTLLSKLRGF